MDNGNGSGGRIRGVEEVVVTELLPEEFEILKDMHPFSEIGLPDPLKTKVIAARRADTGEVVGAFFLNICFHTEPLWIHEDYRKRPGLLKKLWRAMRNTMLEMGAPVAFAVLHDYSDIPRGVLTQAVGIGFSKVPGSLFMLNLADTENKVNKLLDGYTVDMSKAV